MAHGFISCSSGSLEYELVHDGSDNLMEVRVTSFKGRKRPTICIVNHADGTEVLARSVLDGTKDLRGKQLKRESVTRGGKRFPNYGAEIGWP